MCKVNRKNNHFLFARYPLAEFFEFFILKSHASKFFQTKITKRNKILFTEA